MRGVETDGQISYLVYHVLSLLTKTQKIKLSEGF